MFRSTQRFGGKASIVTSKAVAQRRLASAPTGSKKKAAGLTPAGAALPAGVAAPPPPKELAAAARARKAAGKLRFDAYKAGLQTVDKAHVERIIQEASKGSAFYQKEQRRDDARRAKIEDLMKKVEGYKSLSPQSMQKIRELVDAKERDLEETRDVRRRYIHVDMDMFYAAVEEKKNPTLRDVPFGVGTQQMLATTNYIARQYGVRSGMPGFIGKRLCPDLLIVPVDFASYRREAAIVQSIAARYDSQYQSVGLDELTMDVTKYLEEFPSLTAAQVAYDFRDEVFAKTQLTCSGGIAPTAAFSKIASNVNKPNGQHEITLLSRQDFLDYMKDIPLRKIPGIGYAQEMSLNALNIKTCGDLLKNKYLLAYVFKQKTFEHYLAVGLGLMGTTHSLKHHECRQSIGKEVSFSDPLASSEALSKTFRTLLETCHVQCVRKGLLARQMRLVLKYHSYDNEQYSISLPQPTNDLKLWLEAGKKLLATHLDSYAEYRLVGVRMQLTSDAVPNVEAPSRIHAKTGEARSQYVTTTHPTNVEVMGDVEEEEEEHHRAQDADRDDDSDTEVVVAAATRSTGRKARSYTYAAASASNRLPTRPASIESASKKIKAAAVSKSQSKKKK